MWNAVCLSALTHWDRRAGTGQGLPYSAGLKCFPCLTVEMCVWVNCTVRQAETPSVCTGNEWRTRYETQQELNRQLERQIGDVQERLESLRGNPMGKINPKSIKK